MKLRASQATKRSLWNSTAATRIIRIEFDLEGIDEAVEKFSSECERIGPDD